ncbi:MAG: DUF4177 domain-containing protein [Defluviitaleaceae bacterium]|nr:DUF4177 domain-containing protein [Defluviitaleaceae bacterium]
MGDIYEYEYVHVETAGIVFGFNSDEHRSIINKYAKAGWRYVGFMPTYQRGNGVIRSVDLIFEKPCDA